MKTFEQWCTELKNAKPEFIVSEWRYVPDTHFSTHLSVHVPQKDAALKTTTDELCDKLITKEELSDWGVLAAILSLHCQEDYATSTGRNLLVIQMMGADAELLALEVNEADGIPYAHKILDAIREILVMWSNMTHTSQLVWKE